MTKPLKTMKIIINVNCLQEELLRVGVKDGLSSKSMTYITTKQPQYEIYLFFYLFYLTLNQDPTPAGTIPVLGASIQNATKKSNKDYCFEVITPDRAYYLVTDTREEYQKKPILFQILSFKCYYSLIVFSYDSWVEALQVAASGNSPAASSQRYTID